MYTTKLKNIRAGFSKLLLTAFFLLVAGSAGAQEAKVLKGRIVDTDGNPIVGAVINVAEASRIALSDKEGYFSLKNVKNADELCISSVGYLSATAIAEFTHDFKVVLEEDKDLYAHTTPVAFGRKPIKLVTEATSVVTGQELVKHPVTVLQNAFTSTVTGVETYEQRSEPGWSETAMFIRGIRTMNAQARAPLVIVDNVERDLSFLDAYPIENVTILKDAAACAIYGMRGANGAIIVTTKRGETGKTKINFTQEFGFQTLSGVPENQNSYNMALTRNQVAYLDGGKPVYSDEDIEKYRRVSNGEQLDGMDKYKYFNTNWNDVMYRDAAPQYKTNLSISGGNARARYYVSFSYLRQEGMWNSEWTGQNDGYSTQHALNRYNLRSNIDIDVNKFLNVSLDLGGRIDNISQPAATTWTLTTMGYVENSPMNPIFCPNGEFFFPSDNDSKNGAALLVGSGMEKNRRRNLYSTVTATGDLGSLVPGLKANVTFSFDSYETFQARQTADINGYYYNMNEAVSDVSEYKYTRMRTYAALSNPTTTPREYYYNLNMNGGLSYDYTFGKHLINARAFVRSYQNVVRGQESSHRYLSYNAQATYAYDNRYIFSGNISRMGSDNYADGERFATFPGASIGWVASEESWLKNSFVDLLKLRASYGRAGQAATGAGRYPYQGTFQEGSGYNFGTSQSYTEGAYEATAGNRNNKWELSDMLNLGVDFDLWNKKIYGAIDVFKEWRSNILVNRSTVPTLFGLNAPQDSYGKAESKGMEITLGHRNNIGKFNYYVEGMLSWNTNKITEMDELNPDYEYQRKTGSRIFDYGQDYLGGRTVGGFNMLIFDQWASDPNLVATSQQDAIDHPEKYPYHVSSNGKQTLGTAVFKDLNGDRQIDTNDKKPNGYTNIPELLPSLRLGFEWHGFDARVVLTAYLNRTVATRENMAYSAWGKMGTHEVTKAWGYYTDDPTDSRNINAKYPRISNTFNSIDSSYPYNENSIWLVNGDFLSLRNVEFGYSLPKTLISKISLTQCRFYFSGYNLCSWSHMPKGFDAENPQSYVWNYPKTKSFSFGVNIGF